MQGYAALGGKVRFGPGNASKQISSRLHPNFLYCMDFECLRNSSGHSWFRELLSMKADKQIPDFFPALIQLNRMKCQVS